MFRLLMLFTSFIIIITCVKAQTETIARLKKHLEITGNTAEKLNALFALCEQGYTLHPDTLMYYASKAKSMAVDNKNIHSEVKAMYYQSFALTNKGLIDSSLNTANHCIDILKNKKISDPVLMGDVLNQKGRCYMRKSQYKEAIDMGYQVINEAEKGRDALLQMKGKTLVGWAYLEMGQTEESLNWHLKALHTTEDTLVLEKYGILFANIALNYNVLGKTDSALYFIDKAILYSRRNENLFALSNSLAIQAQLFVTAGQPKQAEAPLKEVIGIRKLIGDPFYIVSDMAQLALYYAHNQQPEKGIALCNEGIAIAEKYKLDTKLFFLYSTLAESYKASGSMIKYSEVLEKIISLKDSVYQKNSAEALAAIQTKYNLQKKENLIIKQQADIDSKNYFFLAIFLFLFFALIVAWLLFKGYKRKQQMTMELMVQEEKRLSYEAVLHAEENERKRIAADMHDNMGAYVSAISANVDDVILNNADIPALQNIKNNATDIMMNLRDTIWVLNKSSISITGISDRIKVFMQKLGNSYPYIQMELAENITHDVSFTPEKSLHILRILQEALHNALKHSNATTVKITIQSNPALYITIADNGNGFPESSSYEGYGISNMKERAKQAGMQLALKQLQPSGTEMILTGDTLK